VVNDENIVALVRMMAREMVQLLMNVVMVNDKNVVVLDRMMARGMVQLLINVMDHFDLVNSE
jgi:hypothetical protein